MPKYFSHFTLDNNKIYSKLLESQNIIICIKQLYNDGPPTSYKLISGLHRGSVFMLGYTGI